MVASNGRPMRALQLPRTIHRGEPDGGVPNLPEPIPARAVAPDWSGPTEDNGLATPRGELHIALLAPDAATAATWRTRARVIIPPLWKGGKVQLHIVTQDPAMGDAKILLAMIDLGLIDAQDAGIVGYPSGLPA
jgi:hypothetical protein